MVLASTCVPPVASVNQSRGTRHFACRLSRQRQLFPIGLLRFSVVAIAKIPRQRIAVGGKLRIERLCRRDGQSVVQTAARSGRVPALEGMAGFDRRARRGGCRRIRLACRGDAGFAINGAAVRSGVPLDRQADRCAAVITSAIAVRIHMIGVFFATCLADGTGLRALMLGIAYA